MTIHDQIQSERYQISADVPVGTMDFAFPHRLISPEDLIVVRVDQFGVQTTLVLNVDFTFSGTQDSNGIYPSGGYVHLTGSPTQAGEIIALERATPITQTAAYGTAGKYPADSHEAVLDKMTMILQDLKRLADRAIKSDITSEQLNIRINTLIRLVEENTAGALQAAQDAVVAANAAADEANAAAAAAAASAAAASAGGGILDAKGQLLSHNGTAQVKVPVGPDGYIIVADSTQPVGWKWAPSGGLDGKTIGEISGHGGPIAPSKHIHVYGQAISRTTYSALFAVIGTTYGAGDGVTTFNVPDLRGRFELGLDNMGGIAASRVTNASVGGANATTLGGVGGEQVHTLTRAELPNPLTTTALAQGVPSGASTNGLRSSSSSGGGVINNTGGGQPHSIMNPWIAVNKIMFVGV